jgi:outer membrane protein OmpA-like peptidoglycan-associated protein
MNFKHIFMLMFTFLSLQVMQAQTQEEIERMLNGGTSPAPTEETKKEKVAKEKTVKEKEEKTVKVVEEKAAKTEKEAKVKAEKVEKEAKTSSPEEKVAKEKEVKVEKAAKEEKVKEVKEEKPTVVKETAPTKESETKTTASRTSPEANKLYRTWNFGVYGGLTNPVTDIRYKDWFGTIDPKNENQWNAGVKVTKMFDAAFGLQWRGSYNVVQGAFDSLVIHREDRNYLEDAGITEGIYFKSNVISTSMNIYWNISNTVFGTNRYLKAKMANKPIKPRKFSLYMFTGVGGTWFDTKVKFIDDDTDASFPNVTFQPGKTFEINIPMALGAKFNLGKTVDLGFEYVVNYVFTDKLDGFAFDHPGRIKNDLFTNLNVTLDFKLASKKKSTEHIEWVNPMARVYDEIARIDEMDKKLKKLTKDEDEDGVSDYFDKDLETEAGVVVDGSGKALDSDGDGIPDKADLEPFSDKGADVDDFGVSLDDDKDGVPNHLDLEKNTPEGSFVNFQGIAFNGKVKEGEYRGVSFPSIFFDTDDATIKREYEDELFTIAKDMLRLKDVTFLLSGHCDERGSDEYNLELGQRRADAVKAYLVENYNIEANRIQTISKGKSEMNSPRFNINRRVDVLFH